MYPDKLHLLYFACLVILTYMLQDIYIYQIGDALGDYYLFKKRDTNLKISRAFKTILSDNALGNGQSRARGFGANFKQDYTASLSFPITNEESRDYIEKLIFGSVIPCYFYKVIQVGATETDTDLIFYWQYIEVTKPFDYDKNQNEQSGSSQRIYNIEFRLLDPFLIECDKDQRYLNLTNLANWKNKYDSGITYDSLIRYDDYMITAYLYLYALTSMVRSQIFNQDLKQFPLIFNDTIFKTNSTPELKSSPNLLTRTTSLLLDSGSPWQATSGVSVNNDIDTYNRNSAFQISFNGTSKDFWQYREGILKGDVITLSFLYKANSTAGTLNCNIVERDTINNVDKNTYTTVLNCTTVWQTFLKTYTIQDAATSAIRLSLNNLGQSLQNFDIQEVMLNFGSAALPYYTNDNYNLYDINFGNSLSTQPLNNGPITTTAPINLNCNYRVMPIIRYNKLLQNETFSIENLDNQSYIQIQWLNSSNTKGFVFNTLTNQATDLNGNQYSEYYDYTITTTLNGDPRELLYFNGLQSLNPLTINNTTQNIRFIPSYTLNRLLTIKGVKLSHL